jgi:hypothetical protein
VQLGQQVGDDQHRPALAAPRLGVVPEVQVGAVVKALVGLIEQQQPWLAEQGEGEAELLPGAAGQVTYQRSGSERDPERGEQLAAFHGRVIVPGGEQGEVLVWGEQVEQRGLLRAVPDGRAAADGAGIGGSSPAQIRSKVVLPEPFSPVTAITCPG